MSALKTCPACSRVFKSKFCPACSPTVKTQESQHPAILADQLEIIKASPEHVAKCIAELGIEDYVLEVKPEDKKTVCQITCEHEFKELYFANQCYKCDLFEAQQHDYIMTISQQEAYR